MSEKKYILYGAGRQGILALQKYGKERVAFFCDGYSDLEEVEGIPLLRPDELNHLLQEDSSYTVVITPKIEKVRIEIIRELEKQSIPYLIFEKTDGSAYGTKTFRICGDGATPVFIVDEEETKGYNWRVQPTVALYRAMFSKYKEDFVGKQVDITVYVGDHILDAYRQLHSKELSFIFAYSTIYPLSDRVIPIPDYRVCFDADNYPFEESPEACKKAGEVPWTDSRIAWRGTIASDDERRWLEILSLRYPEILYVDDPAWEENKVYIPMTELAKYKYTLDIRGYGWTDRVKILMQLRRPLFLVDRPYEEWFFGALEPMKHYVPVKEDLSDLLDRYDYLEHHPEVYDNIVKEAADFADSQFSPDAVM